MKYIERFPKPLLEDIVRNRCLPIIGAGFSLNANIPSGKKMPLWENMADELADELSGYPKSSPIDIISAYTYEFTRSKLIERLNELLLVDVVKPGKAHLAFCNCFFDLVVTTNFDFLLERGYEQVEKYCQPIVEEDQLPIGKKEPHVTVLKLHGDLNHPTRLVATEDDYDLFLEKYPLLATFLANLLIVRTPLLIGYSLEDPDFRHIWQIIGDRLGNLRRPAYVLTVSAKSSDIARYERRGVKVINLPGNKEDYPEILHSVFSELRDYWATKLPSVSTITDEKSIADLALPVDATNRLCYFSVPSNSLSFYRTVIFPLAIKNGLTPITVEDVISPGDSITAKIASLLSRADVVVAEADSRWVLYEMSKLPTKVHVLLINSDNDISFINQKGRWTYIKKPNEGYLESDEFQQQIAEWFTEVSEKMRPQLFDEPLRLFNKGEYRAAAISALSLLETTFRQYIENDRNYYPQFKYASISKINEYLVINGIIKPELGRNLRKWITIRNHAIHEGRDIQRKEAKDIVEGVRSVINILQHVLEETASGIEDID